LFVKGFVAACEGSIRLSTDGDYLKGHLLIAMPSMGDDRFERTVIYVCVHSPQGAMGLVVNRLVDHINFPDLLENLDIDLPSPAQQIRVHFGGPVESSRGFVLHSADYDSETTLPVDGTIGLTASTEILRAIAEGNGPRHSLLALGYAGWGPGQLDSEMQANAWLHAPADTDLIFGGDLDGKWGQAVAKLGVDVSLLSGEAGHA
jgi:putative transcriptional regulator